MKAPQRKFLLSAAASLLSLGLSASGAFAQAATATTDPVGFTTLTVAGKPANARGFTYLSLNMARPSVFRGLVPAPTAGSPGLGAATSSGATVLTFPAGTFTSGAFTTAASPSYIELKNGTSSGLTSQITANTDSTITLADDITSAITSGTTTVLVRPNWTFASAFGANNSAGLQGSSTATNADLVQVINPSTGVAITYFYSTTNNRWQTGFTDATNVVIPPKAGLSVERKTSTPVSFTLVGEVKLGPSGIMITGGSSSQNFNLVPNPYPLPSVTLANSQLFTGNAATGVVGGPTASNADTVGILNSTTGVVTNYFYSTTNNRWQTGFTDASNVVIPEGAAVLITRKGGRSSFVWYVPQPAINL